MRATCPRRPSPRGSATWSSSRRRWSPTWRDGPPRTTTPTLRPSSSSRPAPHLAEGDLLQASEKGWGVAAQMVKAVAETRGWRHSTHGDLYHVVGPRGGGTVPTQRVQNALPLGQLAAPELLRGLHARDGTVATGLDDVGGDHQPAGGVPRLTVGPRQGAALRHDVVSGVLRCVCCQNSSSEKGQFCATRPDALLYQLGTFETPQARFRLPASMRAL